MCVWCLQCGNKFISGVEIMGRWFLHRACMAILIILVGWMVMRRTRMIWKMKRNQTAVQTRDLASNNHCWCIDV